MLKSMRGSRLLTSKKPRRPCKRDGRERMRLLISSTARPATGHEVDVVAWRRLLSHLQPQKSLMECIQNERSCRSRRDCSVRRLSGIHRYVPGLLRARTIGSIGRWQRIAAGTCDAISRDGDPFLLRHGRWHDSCIKAKKAKSQEE